MCHQICKEPARPEETPMRDSKLLLQVIYDRRFLLALGLRSQGLVSALSCGPAGMDGFLEAVVRVHDLVFQSEGPLRTNQDLKHPK